MGQAHRPNTSSTSTIGTADTARSAISPRTSSRIYTQPPPSRPLCPKKWSTEWVKPTGWGRRDSNPHWRRFKRPASTCWATSPGQQIRRLSEQVGIVVMEPVRFRLPTAVVRSTTTAALRPEEHPPHATCLRCLATARTPWWDDGSDPTPATPRRGLPTASPSVRTRSRLGACLRRAARRRHPRPRTAG